MLGFYKKNDGATLQETTMINESIIKTAYKNKNVAITGGLGMMGSSLAHDLVKLGANVLLIDNYLHPYGANLVNLEGIKDKVQVNVADIRDKHSMEKLMTSQDFVFHFASQVSHNISMENPKLDMEINCLGTLNVLQACRKKAHKAKIFFAGSRFQFGKIEYLPVDEKHPTNPLSAYAVHKLTAEKYCLMFNKHYGMDTVIFRIANPYGPRSQMKHSKYSIVNWFLRQAMEGKDITIFGDGKQLRDYIYISDLVQAFLAAGATEKSKGQVYNVGSGTGTRFVDMVKEVVKVVGNGKVVKLSWPEDYEAVETGDYVTDISKIRNHTGWTPKVSLKEGLIKTFEYYKGKEQLYWT